MLATRHAQPRSRKPYNASLLAVCASFAAVSCASLAPVPGAGGPRWVQVVSEHSVLLTDEPEPLAIKASARIEQEHAALCKLAFHCDALPHPKLRVIALRDASQFEQLYGADAPGAFTAELLYEPQLVLANGFSQASAALLSRVLTRSIAEDTLGPLPAWLASGLASYFETARFDVAGAFVVGDPVRRHTELLTGKSRQPRLGAEALLNQQPSAADTPQFAASAWLLVHYLQSERRADLEAFFSSIASGQELTAAFHEAFSDLAPELLDAQLDRYLHVGSYLTQSERFEQPPAAAATSALSDADVYSLRAEIAAAAPARKEMMTNQLTLALHSDPNHLRATLLRGQPTAADAITTAHPESWLAWVHAAYTQPEVACSSTVSEHLHTLAPDNAHVLAIAARCAISAGQRDQALALSKRAYAAYPSSPRITLSHARILQEAGACEELAALRERTLIPSPSPAQAPVSVTATACVSNTAP